MEEFGSVLFDRWSRGTSLANGTRTRRRRRRTRSTSAPTLTRSSASSSGTKTSESTSTPKRSAQSRRRSPRSTRPAPGSPRHQTRARTDRAAHAPEGQRRSLELTAQPPDSSTQREPRPYRASPGAKGGFLRRRPETVERQCVETVVVGVGAAPEIEDGASAEAVPEARA